MNHNLFDSKLANPGSYYFNKNVKKYINDNLICSYFDTKYHSIEKI